VHRPQNLFRRVAAPVVIALAVSVPAPATARVEARGGPVTTTPQPPSAKAVALKKKALSMIGTPYSYSGTTPGGFDCSGFTSYVYAQVGITLPRSSADQRYAGTVVSASAAQPGDLIWTPGHVAIYAGDGMQIDSPRPGKTIQFRSIWQSNPTFIRVG
jgi:cell wall-associated NlpC family hydrolase